MAAIAVAMERAWASDSMTQGPAIRKRSGPPMETWPTGNGGRMGLLDHSDGCKLAGCIALCAMADL